MEQNECYLAGSDMNWMKIHPCNVHMAVKRRVQRTVIRGNGGDDLLDEGAESSVYTITGSMAMAQYKGVLKLFRSGQPWFHDPFEERQMKAVFLSIDYDSATGEFEFVLLEDAEQHEVKA